MPNDRAAPARQTPQPCRRRSRRHVPSSAGARSEDRTSHKPLYAGSALTVVHQASEGRSWMSRRPQRAPKRKNHLVAELEAEITRLHQELANIYATLKQLEQGGADAFLTRRITELEEGQRVARGQAVEAVVARSRAEAELRALEDAIGKAQGLSGWLLRRARKRLRQP
jgi:hypothetical protein